MSTKEWKAGLKKLGEMLEEGTMEQVSNDDPRLDQCAYAICSKDTPEIIALIPPMWTDRIRHGHCGICDEAIIFNDHIPDGTLAVCFECGMDIVKDDEGVQFMTRKSGADELREYVKKKEEN